MKKTVGIILLLVVFAGVTVIPNVFAAVIVHDPQNTAENHATYLQTAQNTLNTATQIANQVTNLASMSPEVMLAHILGIEEEFEDVLETAKQAHGLMKAGQTAQQAWDSAFKKVDSFFDGKTSNINNLADSQNMIYVLDKTYQDSLRVATVTQNIEKNMKRLQEMMKQNQNAVGNKQAIQVQNNLLAQQNTLQITENQVLGTLTTTVVAHLSRQNQADAYATAVKQKKIEECKEIVAEDAALRKQYGVE